MPDKRATGTPATMVHVRVLIVDDSAPVRSRLAAMLRDAGLDVVGEADSATAALQLARALLPEAVVLDLHLPDGNGMNILRALKSLAPPPVIAVLTNMAQTGYRDRCMALGADHFLDKSRDFDQLAPTLLAAR